MRYVAPQIPAADARIHLRYGRIEIVAALNQAIPR